MLDMSPHSGLGLRFTHKFVLISIFKDRIHSRFLRAKTKKPRMGRHIQRGVQTPRVFARVRHIHTQYKHLQIPHNTSATTKILPTTSTTSSPLAARLAAPNARRTLAYARP
ncbi:MAG: hypothetical protein RIR11_1362 [Bacteroidota bacterium]